MPDLEGLLRALAAGSVEFVLVGGMAAAYHGSARVTYDVDVVYGRSPENLGRLAAALAHLEPYLRGAPPGLPFRLDERTLKLGLNFTLTTKLGDLDLLGEITGGGSYDDVLPHSVQSDILGVSCRVVDLPTLVRLKRAAGRPKDLEALSELEALLDEGSEGEAPRS